VAAIDRRYLDARAADAAEEARLEAERAACVECRAEAEAGG
jgi:hypothetical protein